MDGTTEIRHAPGAERDERSFSTTYLHIEDRLYGIVLIRFAVAGAIVIGAAAARHAVGIEGLPVGWLCVLAALLGGANSITFALVRPYRGHRAEAVRDRAFLERLVHATIALDFVFLAVALWLVGGAKSPFQAFFLFHVIIASVLLTPRQTYAHALFGYLLLAALVVGSWRGWIPAVYPEGAVPPGHGISGRYALTVLVVQGLLFSLVALLLTRLVDLLRAGGEQLLHNNRELAYLARLRRDFLQIALHNLRSPVGAVTMHLSNIEDGYGGPLSEKQREWIGRSQRRLGELSDFLHDIELLSALESGGLAQYEQLVDLAPLLRELAETNQDLAHARGHALETDLPPSLAPVRGVPRLIREAVANYLTNAIKYTPEGGRIVLRAFEPPGAVRIEVEDNGPGIPAGDQPRLFQEFVRLRRPGLASETPGSGLGLFIVKHVAEAHRAAVSVNSRPGAGSVFAIEFPPAAPHS